MGPTLPVLLALTLLAAAAGAAPAGDACPRACRCFTVDGDAAANCSSPAAALTLGGDLRALRLSRYDDHLSVKEGAFRALGGLRELRLDHLGLVKVYPGAFRGLDRLETLDLSHNALSAGDELSRALRDLPLLRRLSLRGNNFGAAHAVPPALASRTLKFVDLGGCKLRELPETVLAGLTHVRHVVLDGNFIRSFKAAAFPTSVVSIDLSHNDIDRVSRAELNKLENVDSIELSDNPLHCSCELLRISYDYNMNKPVVCATPKQLMGKDLLKIKKHEVCGGTKKVKREAGNELDDEALSEEDIDEGEDIVYDDPEPEPENTAGTADEPLHKEENADKEGVSETLDDGEESKVPSNDDVDDKLAAPASPSLSETNNKNIEATENFEDEGPEDIDGLDEEHSPKAEENSALDGDEETEKIERVDEHISKNSKSELPPDEEISAHEETRPEESSKQSDVKDTVPVDDGNNEASDTTGDAIRTGDVDAINTEDEDNNGENTATVEEDVASQNEPVDEEPPDSLPASAYNHVQTDGGNADRIEENEGEIDEGNTKHETPEEELSKETAVQTGDASEGKDENADNVEPEGGTGVTLEETNSQEENNKEETENKEENLPEHEETVPVNAENDVVEETDRSELGTPVEGEGARMESATNTEKVEDKDDGDEPTNEDDQDTLNTVNSEDNILSSAIHPHVNEETTSNEEEVADSKGANMEDGADETDSEVENVHDNTNVILTSGIGARAETDPDVDEEKINDGEDDENIEDVDAKISPDNVSENNEDAETEDVAADKVGSDDKIDVAATEDDNAPEENMDDDENDDIVPGSVVAAVNKNEDKVDEDEIDTRDGAGEVTENKESENVNDPEKTLEEELKEDRIHSTLGHEDLGEAVSNENDNTQSETKEPVDGNTEDADEEEDPIVSPPLSADNLPSEEDGMGSEDYVVEPDGVLEEEDRNTPIRHSPVDGPENEEELPLKEYEDVEEKGKDGAPGGSLSLAPVDTDDNDDGEGSGNVLESLEKTVEGNQNKEDDWTEDEVNESGRENEAVAPLGNADSKEIFDAIEEHTDESSILPTENPPIVILGSGDNATEDETGSGGGLALSGVQVEDDETSKETEEGSGQLIGHIPTIKETNLKEEEEEEEEEGSGKGLFIPVPSGHDTTSDWEEPAAENEDEVDDANAATTMAPVLPPEDEIIPRVHAPVFASQPETEPPITHDEEPPALDEDEDEDDEIAEGHDQGRERNDGGRALGLPVEPEDDLEDDKDEEFPFLYPTRGADADVVVVADVAKGAKGNIEAGPGADGSEALNTADMWSLNSIGSYIVLGAIMLIVVILLGYAVCRSRRQKSPSAREKDVESAGRELQDVNKPLINNHHPSAPEKQPLDETRQPLMTKEQEASLTVDPEKKPLSEDDADAANHKPKQNGTVVPEVVVERQAATTPPAAVNGKAASPTAERAPSPAAPAPSPTPAPATPTPSPTADAAAPANGHANGNAVPLANGGSVSPGATTPTAAPPAPAPVSPGAVRVVAKELPDSVAKRPVIIMNRGADPAQQV